MMENKAINLLTQGDTERAVLRRLTVLMGCAIVVMLLVVSVQFYVINESVKQVKGLNRVHLVDHPQQLQQARSIIDRLARQVTELGGDPGETSFGP